MCENNRSLYVNIYKAVITYYRLWIEIFIKYKASDLKIVAAAVHDTKSPNLKIYLV